MNKAAARQLAISIASVLGLLAAAWFTNSIEGRVNPARLGRAATPIVADRQAPLHSQGQLVAVTGKAVAAPLGDNMFLKPGPYLMVRRDYERFGWMQYPKGERVASAPDGSTTVVADYDYRQEWSYNLHDSVGFAVKEGHENPEPKLEKGVYLPPTATLGLYTFKSSPQESLELLTTGEPVKLTPEIMDMSWLKGTLVGDYVYYQDAVASAPKPGDVRVSYYVVLQESEVTVTGTLDGMEIKKNDTGKGSTMYTLEIGGNMNLLEQATQEFTVSQWRWRGFAGLTLLATYWLVLARRLRRSFARFLALPLALICAAGSVVAAMYLEAWAAFGTVIGLAVVVGWWSLGGRQPADDTASKPESRPAASPDSADYLLILNPDGVSPEAAESLPHRCAARAVIFNDDGLVALMRVTRDGYYKLPGGGLEKGESDEVALRRECREEVGAEISIVLPLGNILEYRSKVRQESSCFLARVVGELGAPTFTDKERESGFEVVWVPLDEAVHLVSEAKTTDHAAFVQKRDSRFLEAAQAAVA